ncbi:MAG: alpha-amylase family glycosyl hydrolase [Isosphaeraceae bacterium]
MIFGLASLLALGCLGQPAPDRMWTDEIVYVVYVDRFFNGDPGNDIMARRYGKDRARYEGGFWGGDLAGVVQKLDNLDALGVTTLLLYPVVANDEHPFGKYLPTGYRPRDYGKVDPNFGTFELLRHLVDEAHARGIKVLLDMPLSLPGVENPTYNDPARRDWFGAMSPYGVRQWNAAKPEVADFLINVARDWKTRSGCDGFRLDSAHLLPEPFWTRFAREVKAGGDFVLLAEYVEPPRKIGPFLRATGFDSAYDFGFSAVRDLAGQGRPVGQLAFVTEEAQQFYPRPRAMAAQVDTYEVVEFARVAREPILDRFRLALTALLTIDRVPLLYSGCERALTDREVGVLFREPPANPEFERFVRRLIALRRRTPALRRGAFERIVSEETLFAFTRTLGKSTLLIALNTGDRAQPLRATLGDAAWKDLELWDAFDGRVAKPAGDDHALAVAPITARVFEVRPRP